MATFVAAVGLFVPVNQSDESDTTIIDKIRNKRRMPGSLLLARVNGRHGIVWIIEHEDDFIPLVTVDTNYMPSVVQKLGQAWIAPLGYQWGQGQLVTFDLAAVEDDYMELDNVRIGPDGYDDIPV